VSATSGPLAPPPLRVVQEFVNTSDRRRGRDVLTSDRSLGRWLDSHDLIGHGRTVDDLDVALALRVREGLRDAFDVRHTPGAEAADVINDLARRAGIVPYVTLSGHVRLKATAGGAIGGLGRIVAISMQALLDGTAAGLRVCGDPACRTVYFDGNRSKASDRCGDPLCGGGGHRLRVRRIRKSRSGGDADGDA
jgi:predicted RNA-binding Zn ribbon-like protein